VALMLDLPAGRRNIGVPALGHPPSRELDIALVERRLELQQEHALFEIEDLGHEQITLAKGSGCVDQIAVQQRRLHDACMSLA
jgi:hypothetical protein